MSANTSRTVVVSLYKSLLKEAKKFPDFNYRSYFVRRIRDGFRESQHFAEQAKIAEQVRYAEENLQLIKRQILIGHMFGRNQPLSVEVTKSLSGNAKTG